MKKNDILVIIGIVLCFFAGILTGKLLCQSCPTCQTCPEPTKCDVKTEETTTLTEKDKVEAVVNKFVAAINSKDWATVKELSNETISNEIQQYGIKNVTANMNTYRVGVNDSNCFIVDIQYESSVDQKDVGLGNYLVIDKTNYVISTFGATNE